MEALLRPLTAPQTLASSIGEEWNGRKKKKGIPPSFWSSLALYGGTSHR
jgi:hypothetical protein